MRCFNRNGLTLVLAAMTVSAYAQQVTNRLQLAKGQKYIQETSVKMNMSQEMAGQSTSTGMESASYQSLNVTDVQKNRYEIQMTTDRMVFRNAVMGNEMNYDSDKKEGNDEGLEAKMISSTLLRKGHDQVDVGDLFSSMFGDSAATQLNKLFMTFPAGRKLGKGDRWTDSTEFNNEGKIKTIANYTLLDIRDGVVSISLSGYTLTQKRITQQGMDIDMDIKSQNTGEILVDLATGLPKQRAVHMDMTGKIEVLGQSVPLSMKMVIVSDLKPASRQD
jgi:hypothetical protein